MNILQALPRIAQIVRRCPTSTLMRAYRDAARSFCGESRWLREDIDVTTEADEPSYALASANVELETIGVRLVIGAQSDGTRQWGLNPLDKTLWSLNARSGQPRFHAYSPEGTIEFHLTPNAIYSMAVTAQMQPTVDATTVPDQLDSKWGRAIDDGALGYLLDLPGQTWTDHVQALTRRKAFQAAINNAKADEQRGYNQGSVRVRQRLFITPRC